MHDLGSRALISHSEGVDGSWSTLNVRGGSPPQSIRVMISTNSPMTILVQPAGCADAVFPRGVPPNCATSRGGLFNINATTSWINQGWYSLNDPNTHYGFEANLGYTFNLNYGLDSLGLDYQEGANGPTLANQTIATYNLPKPLYHGLFGLGKEPVLYETFGNYSAPSYFQTLRTKNMIPSLSWSYTAGASYRLSAGQYAQLVFGGYDVSRFQPNDVQFRLNPDVSRDIVVAVQSISISGANAASLLPTPIYAFVESTDPNIWLPIEACAMFEQAFGLTWDNDVSRYLMNDTVYERNLATNTTVNFRLAISKSGGATVNIALPFEALAPKIQYPLVTNTTRYFPLQRAANDTQYTLGRAFLQEAYLTVDYDRGNFTITQCTWNQGAAPLITTILPPNSTKINKSNQGPKSIPVGGIAGGVIGFCVIVAVVLIGLWWYVKHRKSEVETVEEDGQTPQAHHSTPFLEQTGEPGVNESGAYQDHADKIHEFDNENEQKPHEADSRGLLPEAGGNEIFHLSSDTRTDRLAEPQELAANKEIDTVKPVATSEVPDALMQGEQPARAKSAHV